MKEKTLMYFSYVTSLIIGSGIFWTIILLFTDLRLSLLFSCFVYLVTLFLLLSYLGGLDKKKTNKKDEYLEHLDSSCSHEDFLVYEKVFISPLFAKFLNSLSVSRRYGDVFLMTFKKCKSCKSFLYEGIKSLERHV